MLDFKKKVDIKPQEDVLVEKCPSCDAYVCHRYYMEDKSSGKKSQWWACSCGIVWNAKKPTKVYDRKYWDDNSKYLANKEAEYQYPVKIYAPIIEELIYGRRVLIVGRPNTYQEEAFAERGWVPTVIDKNTSFESKGHLIASDFETYQFPENPKYNLIWFYGTFECLANPIGSLDLCKKLLAEDGIIFIASPDTDFINTRSSSVFIHWKNDEHHVMWNKRAISKHMESIGFNTILCRSNYEHRFPQWDDFHGIWQRRFF